MFRDRYLTQIVTLLTVGLLFVNTGCLAVALGTVAAGGAAAAAYAYANGRYYRDYPTRLPDALEATRTAMKELQFPIDKEEPSSDKDYIESKTGDGDPIRVYLESIPSRIPAEGGVIRIGVRVGMVNGDQKVSQRLLDQISLHLVAPVQVQPVEHLQSATPRLQPTANLAPLSQTAPPPLAPAK